MARVRPYQGSASTPGGEAGFDEFAEFVFDDPSRPGVRRRLPPGFLAALSTAYPPSDETDASAELVFSTPQRPHRRDPDRGRAFLSSPTSSYEPEPSPPDLPQTRFHGKPLVAQVVRPSARPGEAADRRDPQYEDRLRRFTQQVSVVLNSLHTQGYLREVEPGVWQVVTGALSAPRPPGVADDELVGAFRGAHWVDTVGLTGWMCLDATAGAAIWKQTTS